ncbi:MAG: hypothetical protein VKL39_13290, partial [Leptolyngbyaceae bacterium]|nr:hypothetical protein [Leptolyngbyaceae bacterium]
MVRDRIGNSLKKAKRINLSRGNVRFRDAVDDPHDSTDLYRVKLGSRSRLKVRISLQQRTGNADVEIYALKNKKRSVFRQIGRRAFDDLKRRDVWSHLERVGRSRRKGRRNEKLNVTLDSGLYFIRVFPKSGETRYTLKAVAKPAQLPPPVSQPRSPSQPPTVVSPSISPPPPPLPRSVKPLIQLSSPNGGESFTTGESIAITWTDTLTAPVQIDLF